MTLQAQNSTQLIELAGCTPTPLANYLKAIGILRLLSEQTDATVRGFWRSDRFWLQTTLSPSTIVDFFLHDYSPTPLISPWNGGSGFYPKDSKEGIEPIQSGSAVRLEPYRLAIAAGRQLVGESTEKPTGPAKDAMLLTAYRQFRGPLGDWLRAALILDAAGSPAYPAILGTGGNDGRLDFTNNFMQRLASLYETSEDGSPAGTTELFIRQSLFDEPVSDLLSVSIGQFSPGAAGGANSGAGFTGSTMVNPMDFCLMLEGAIAFTPAMVRRSGLTQLPGAAAPFAIHAASAGYGTAGAEEKSRGEQWMPLWSQPTGFAEFKRMLSHARLRIGDASAARPRDAARAVARCGTALGIEAFERYAYLERNGQANLAIPLGRWSASAPVRHAELIDDIAPWVDRYERAARGKNAPAAWGRHERRVTEAIMRCCQRSLSRDWITLLRELGRAEISLLRSPRATAGAALRPLPELSAGWLNAIGDAASPAVRLAVALACQAGPRRPSNATPSDRPTQNLSVDWRGDPIRRHFIPIKQSSDGRVPYNIAFASSDDSLTKLNEHLAAGGVAWDEAAAIVRRRITTAASSGHGARMPLVPLGKFAASLSDLLQLIAGQVDLQAVFELARPLMALRWLDANRQYIGSRHPFAVDRNNEYQAAESMTTYGVWRLCHHWSQLPIRLQDNSAFGHGIDKDIDVRLDPQLVSLMDAGRPSAAIAKASRRLRVSGLPVKIDSAILAPSVGRRWVASLLWGISNDSINRLAKAIVHRPAADFHIAEPDPDEEPQPSDPQSV